MALIVLRARAGAAGSARCVGCVVRESWADAGAALRCARGTDALRDGAGWIDLGCARGLELMRWGWFCVAALRTVGDKNLRCWGLRCGAHAGLMRCAEADSCCCWLWCAMLRAAAGADSRCARGLGMLELAARTDVARCGYGWAYLSAAAGCAVKAGAEARCCKTKINSNF